MSTRNNPAVTEHVTNLIYQANGAVDGGDYQTATLLADALSDAGFIQAARTIRRRARSESGDAQS